MRYLAVLLPLFLFACPKKGDHPAERPDAPSTQPGTETSTQAAGDRSPAVAKDHPLYARVEGTGFANACTGDEACMVGGCSAEVCSAEEVNTTCEFPEGGFPKGEACGCVSGECIWYGSQVE